MVQPEHPLLAKIREWLLSLDLSDFEQTTHGRLGPCEISDVADELRRAYENPTGYNISNLSQAIRGLTKNAHQA